MQLSAWCAEHPDGEHRLTEDLVVKDDERARRRLAGLARHEKRHDLHHSPDERQP